MQENSWGYEELILAGILVLSACSPLATALPTTISTKSSTFTPAPTETSTPIPTMISTPTLEPISGGWSTFHSTDYGFSFQYPAAYDDGFYKPEIDPQAFCNIETGEDRDGNYGVWVGIIQITVKQVEQNLDEFSSAFVKDISLDWNVSSINQIFLDGVPARQIEYSHKTKTRWGIKSFAIQDNLLNLLEFYDMPFSDCSHPDIKYSDYWVFEQIMNTWEFDD